MSTKLAHKQVWRKHKHGAVKSRVPAPEYVAFRKEQASIVKKTTKRTKVTHEVLGNTTRCGRPVGADWTDGIAPLSKPCSQCYPSLNGTVWE